LYEELCCVAWLLFLFSENNYFRFPINFQNNAPFHFLAFVAFSAIVERK